MSVSPLRSQPTVVSPFDILAFLLLLTFDEYEHETLYVQVEFTKKHINHLSFW